MVKRIPVYVVPCHEICENLGFAITDLNFGKWVLKQGHSVIESKEDLEYLIQSVITEMDWHVQYNAESNSDDFLKKCRNTLDFYRALAADETLWESHWPIHLVY